ncbi:MAG: 3-phosphoshikimate 1-carboxyvinyltransferase [Coriobacteriaceae bacterium]|nr:3-phosphoshikimate 1-carboxyvinyltransferase [Coriobacteriaceae bacterium]
MNALVTPSPLSGTIHAIPSKSEAHRALICAALANGPTRIVCRASSEDIDATIGCLETLGARISRSGESFDIEPIPHGSAASGTLDCRESGSTLRFLLPVASALGGASFAGSARLSERPLGPLVAALRAQGVAIDTDGTLPLTVSAGLASGIFELPGNISSQYITGILLAAPLLDGACEIRVSEPIESRPYIALTLDVLHAFGVDAQIVLDDARTSYLIPAKAAYRSPGTFTVGGDWSNAAFWLAAGALSDVGVEVAGLSPITKQADRAVIGALALFGAQVARSGHATAVRRDTLRGARIDVSSCPDLVPAIAPLAAIAEGRSEIVGAGRLRLKESDRLASIADVLGSLGAHISIEDDALIFEGVDHLHGGTVDAHNDHRIAMMAAIAATCADSPVLIRGAQCTAKSYPGFFDDLAALGGIVELEA